MDLPFGLNATTKIAARKRPTTQRETAMRWKGSRGMAADKPIMTVSFYENNEWSKKKKTGFRKEKKFH